jgi:hypothetical protein
VIGAIETNELRRPKMFNKTKPWAAQNVFIYDAFPRVETLGWQYSFPVGNLDCFAHCGPLYRMMCDVSTGDASIELRVYRSPFYFVFMGYALQQDIRNPN